MSKKVICWFSGGITSAVACKKAIEMYGATPIYIETGSHHPDSMRFLKDCEVWYGKSIQILQSTKYEDHFDVIRKDKYVNGPAGARCTMVLKRHIREKWERENKGTYDYVWGFEFGAAEQLRAERIKVTIPGHSHMFPLIDLKLSKPDCINLVAAAGIEIPMMYKLGFNNNNCIGCVKGGMAYWNLVRKNFPEHFNKMAVLEREIGRSCLKKYFLDELPLDAGRGTAPLVQDCGSVGEGCMTTLSRQYHGRE